MAKHDRKPARAQQDSPSASSAEDEPASDPAPNDEPAEDEPPSDPPPSSPPAVDEPVSGRPSVDAPDEEAPEPRGAGDRSSGSLETPGDIVERVRAAQRQWAETALRDRIDAIAELRPRILARAEEIAQTVAKETGKPVEEAVLAEVLPNADLVRYWIDSIEELLDGSNVELSAMLYPGKAGRIHRDPRGVVLLITPWNYPVAIPLRTLVPALLAGNGIVFKPSEVATRSGALVASLFDGLLPADLFALVQGGPEVGAALVASPVDLVVFTGGRRTGRAVARSCAERFVPCSLELGGKDAAIVLADCDVERAARGVVWGAFTNAGQNCASIERVYVEKAIAEAFTNRVVALTRELRTPQDVGPLTTKEQRRVVHGQLTEALDAGATLLEGQIPESETDSPKPIVLRLEGEDLAIEREETFGPVLPLRVVADVEDAVRRANDSRYALTTSVWTRRIDFAHGLARRLRSGVVTINNHGFTAALPAAPWTGPDDTGSGITNSPHALATLTRTRFVLEDRNRAKRELWWYPYTPTLRALAFAMAALRGGAGVVARFVAFFRLLLLLPKRLLGKD